MNKHPYFVINNVAVLIYICLIIIMGYANFQKDLHRLYAVFDRFSSTAVINPSKWADAFLSAPPDETYAPHPAILLHN